MPKILLFNGIPAPLLYSSEGQINALVPYGIAGTTTVTVQVNTPAGNSLPATLHPAVTQPQVFRQGAYAFAVNQDATLNSPSNPASPGTLVTIYASGAGRPLNGTPDGSIAQILPDYRVLSFPLAVLYNDLSLEVPYAGPAPSLVANLLQINLRLPSRPRGSFRLMLGDQLSEPFLLHFLNDREEPGTIQHWPSSPPLAPTRQI